MQQKLDTSVWVGIDEGLLCRILCFLILQQRADALLTLSAIGFCRFTALIPWLLWKFETGFELNLGL
jgi:hypothetical protein